MQVGVFDDWLVSRSGYTGEDGLRSPFRSRTQSRWRASS